jgi:hypothetical protein
LSAIRSAAFDSLLDVEQVDVPIKIWRMGNPEIESKYRVVFAIDAVAFRPTITIRKDGIIEGLRSLQYPYVIYCYNFEFRRRLNMLRPSHFTQSSQPFITLRETPLVKVGVLILRPNIVFNRDL